MDLKSFATVFGIVLLAELGDKTQLATMLFASRQPGRLLTVFLAASSALVTATAIGVLAGSAIASRVDPRHLSYAAGLGFILIGAWTIWRA